MIVLLTACSVNLHAGQDLYTKEFLHDAFAAGDSLEVAGEPILATGLLSLFYQSRNYEPAWGDLEYAGHIIKLLGKSTEEGLFPADYHYYALADLYAELRSEDTHGSRRRAELDVLLTDGVLLYASHLVNGKISPARYEKTWNYSEVQLLPEKIVYALTNHVDNKTIAQGLESLKPDLKVYRQLKEGLAYFSGLADRERFQEIPNDRALKRGAEGQVVAALRVRLKSIGFALEDTQSTVFDEQLELVVRRFQRRYGLEPDGIVGPTTFDELNVPFSHRANQIRINMDRIRWVVDDLAPDFLLVNIAGFKLWLAQNNEIVWSTDVMTGAIYTQTPLFKATMTYLVLNPTWTVPRSITREMFPRFSGDPSYLARKNYRLLNREGNTVDPVSLNWATLSKGNFPYTLVQMPGEGNALGRVKFMFPNKHAIYLHDTPQKSLFVKARRAFSHGCIRVKNPLKLAELLLQGHEHWDRAEIERVVDSRRLTSVPLGKPVEVLLMYWTVQPDSDGNLGFVPDIYGRDLALIAAIKKPIF